MRNEEEALVVVLVVGFVVAIVAMRHRHAERSQRLRILDNALRDPKIDPATRQELIRTLDTRHRSGPLAAWRTWLGENLTPRRVFGALALGLIVGGGMFAAFGRSYDFEAGMATLSVGVGILALPIVLRELDARAARR